MRSCRYVLLTVLLFMGSGCTESNTDMSDITHEWPVADERPHELTEHGNTRIDNYYWLRDDERKDPDVLGYLNAENAYREKQTEHLRGIEEKLYRELIGRIKQTDESVPVRIDNYWYYERYEEGKEYAINARRPEEPEAIEEIFLDENILAAAHEFYDLGSYEVSPDHSLVAYTEDTVSRGEYTLRVKNLVTGELFPESILRVSTEIAWGNDNLTFYYVKLQEGTLIPYQVYRHILGTAVADDELLYEEKNPEFFLWIDKTRDRKHVMLVAAQTLSWETRLLDADDPDGQFKVFLPREDNHEYDIEPAGEIAYIRSNWQADNFRLMKTEISSAADKSSWEEVIPHSETVFLEDFAVFRDFLVAEERHAGVLNLRVIALDGSKDILIEEEEDAFTAEIDENPVMDTEILRYSYESLATAPTIFDYDMTTGKKTLLKQKPVLGGYDRKNYGTRRVYAKARDGTQIPVTLLFRSGVTNDGTNPIYVLGYGSYGISYDPNFSDHRLTMVDRGFVFALAHIRGGQELGRQWYENGKLLKKKNTFTDYIDVTEFLVREGWGHPEKVVASGRSAGGLLMGAILNMRPELYKVAIVGVPFVDVVTTMLDESIPLTTFEWDEWGDPRKKAYYEYMLSYSPYDQVSAQDYPHIWAGFGLWDPAVQYWEPAKWVAKLRATKTDDNQLLMYIDMEAGHRGASGRFKSMKDRAREYAFMFDVLGIGE